jgi:hypothetical protein
VDCDGLRSCSAAPRCEAPHRATLHQERRYRCATGAPCCAGMWSGAMWCGQPRHPLRTRLVGAAPATAARSPASRLSGLFGQRSRSVGTANLSRAMVHHTPHQSPPAAPPAVCLTSRLARRKAVWIQGADQLDVPSPGPYHRVRQFAARQLTIPDASGALVDGLRGDVRGDGDLKDRPGHP